MTRPRIENLLVCIMRLLPRTKMSVQANHRKRDWALSFFPTAGAERGGESELDHLSAKKPTKTTQPYKI